ncbi:very short patch repair endonuclease [Enterocloster citroniae]|uniref:very short patch repair endonuclease n=1 Tax=Enterocloster citroniae TaxID=358743 RepID=UPI0008F3F1F7|nr:very short patch repair endonuclease [Enterocloster citroniae]SFS18840.1 T/G mismatch-specific endonuclease [Enterocloster citroniae]
MDRLTEEQRSKNMRSIKGKDTSIEVILRKALWHEGIRYRKNYKGLPGKPDITITKYKIAVFCDSEFWHGKDWPELEERLKRGRRSEFWINKIERNMERDRETDKKLNCLGWKVIRFWGEDIKKKTEKCVQVVKEAIFEQKMLGWS